VVHSEKGAKRARWRDQHCTAAEGVTQRCVWLTNSSCMSNAPPEHHVIRQTVLEVPVVVERVQQAQLVLTFLTRGRTYIAVQIVHLCSVSVIQKPSGPYEVWEID